MRVGITGASGLIGNAIAAAASAAGHRVVAYSRSPDRPIAHADEIRKYAASGELDLSGLDAIIHLAGESILGRWTEGKRKRIYDSRIASTRGIAAAMGRMDAPPPVFLCGSATGYYGDRGDEALTEEASGGEGFLAEVCRDWEAAAREAPGSVRVVHLRIAVVLARQGGTAQLMGRAFKLGLGGRLGDGCQYLPWIHIDDLAGLALRGLEDGGTSGAVNAAAPEAVTNREFTAAVGRALHRPTVFPVPAAVLKLVGAEASTMVLHSQRVVPAVASERWHYAFRFPTLDAALQDVYS